MTNKLIDNKRRHHAEKILQKLSKGHEHHETTEAPEVKEETKTEETPSLAQGLRSQYDVIREDLLKLREDLNQGFDMAKSLLNRKTIMEELRRMR